jgi:Spx/MgsR family transcriptional regulator
MDEKVNLYLEKQYQMSYTLYGLVNCDVTKKAIKWLKEHNVAFTFHNNKTELIGEEKLQNWCSQIGWEKLLNKKGTAFKGIHPAVQMNANSEKAAIEIMKERTSTIKRPLIEKNGKIITIGFDEKKYEIAYL